MVRQPDGGGIVTLGDVAVDRPSTDSAAFFPSQGAISAMTRSLAVEFAVRNPRVRVNCVLTGTPMQREGTLEHVAHAVLFLLENQFVNGICLPVDGSTMV
jgi:NAD(P)-dependent dehydrogenase (short-subunit alcohol dehydrogenase family)